jgi:uncharacterized membrane protein YjjP (DUF1212 family)
MRGTTRDECVTSKPDHGESAAGALSDAVEALLWFGASMLRAGSSATRTRALVEILAKKLDCDAVALALSLDSITVSARRGGERVTAMREIGPAGIDVARIGELEQLAKSAEAGLAPRSVIHLLADAESSPPRYSVHQIVVAVGVASGGFAFLNGAGWPEMIAAAVGGAVGQCSRAWLARHQVNHYASATLAAVAALAFYVLLAALAAGAGLQFSRYPAGFIASVLFLVPGFPLIAALFDLLQHQTIAAVSRFAHGMMILLAVALGLSIVVALANVELMRQPPLELSYPVKLLLRAIASFAAGCAFAMLFNSPPRTVLAAGMLALVANDLRLALIDMGIMLAPSAFVAALTIGLVAILAEQRFDVSPMAVAVSPTVIMVPGLYAYEMIVLFNRGQMLEALQASAVCGFVIGALAMGLAAARFLVPNR